MSQSGGEVHDIPMSSCGKIATDSSQMENAQRIYVFNAMKQRASASWPFTSTAKF
jgi:hypothetical protein